MQLESPVKPLVVNLYLTHASLNNITLKLIVMKQFGTLLISGIFAICFSLSAAAQSSGMDLDQVELLKQLAGSWEAEIGEDTTLTWEAIPFGKGYELIIQWKAKGEPYLSAKGIMGFVAGKQKGVMSILYPGGGIERAIGEFVSENQLVMEGFNFDHSKILAKYEINIPTPDTWNAEVKVKGSEGTWDVLINYNYVRVN